MGKTTKPQATGFSFDGYDRAQFQRSDQYAAAIDKLYNAAVADFARLSQSATVSPDKLFSFSDMPMLQKQAQLIVNKLASQMTAVIQHGTRESWLYACKKNDDFLAHIMNTSKVGKRQLKRMQDRNLTALDAFQTRKINGMDLSQRVWKYAGETKELIEMGIDISVGDGVPASRMAKELKGYLVEPIRLFRRVRDKHGNLVLSKHAAAYHPGRGVYRSSYQNSLRLARTEINMAYRDSDRQRWAKLDFVVGFEVHLSNNHTCKGLRKGVKYRDICDELAGRYPKEFVFKGWHPNCRCYMTPILKDPKEFKTDQENALRDAFWGDDEDFDANDNYMKYAASSHAITDLPDSFKQWAEDNRERSKRWLSQPYFIRDNFKGGTLDGELILQKPDIPQPKTDKQLADERHAARTPQQIADIKARWEEREKQHTLIRKTANNILKVAQDYGEVDYSTLQKYVNEGNLDKMKIETKALAQHVLAMKKQEQALSTLISNVHEWHKQFSIAELQGVFNAVESKLSQWSSLSLEQQKKKLSFEAIDYLGGNMNGVQSKYTTWKVSQTVYLKQLDAVNYKIDVNAAQTKLDVIKTWLTQHTKATKVAQLAAEAQSAIDAGASIANINVKLDAADKLYQTNVQRAANKASKVAVFTVEKAALSQARKDAARWHKEATEANDYFFDDDVKEFWKNCSDAEKDAFAGYTAGSAYITEPLRAIKNHYYSATWKHNSAEIAQHVEDMTKAMQRVSLKNDVWIKRDAGFWDAEYVFGLRKRLGVAEDNEWEVRSKLVNMARTARSSFLNSADYKAKYAAALASQNPTTAMKKLEKEADAVFQKTLNDKLVGIEGIDRSFMSCGSCKETRFTCTGKKDVIYNIYAPKGTHAVYAQPWSSCGSFGRSWNCSDKPVVSKYSENEVLLQRGTKMRITKVEYDENKDQWYVDVEIIGQNPEQIKGIKSTSGGYYCEF